MKEVNNVGSNKWFLMTNNGAWLGGLGIASKISSHLLYMMYHDALVKCIGMADESHAISSLYPDQNNDMHSDPFSE